MEKRLKNIKTFEQHTSELNISDVSDSFVKGQFYTKHYKDGGKMIFKYKGKSTDKDMIKVYMFCVENGEEYQEDIEVTISKSGTGEGSYIEKSTKEDIDFLTSVSQNYH
jgi:hypothetical protein